MGEGERGEGDRQHLSLLRNSGRKWKKKKDDESIQNFILACIVLEEEEKEEVINGIVARFDPFTERYEVNKSTQSCHIAHPPS